MVCKVAFLFVSQQACSLKRRRIVQVLGSLRLPIQKVEILILLGERETSQTLVNRRLRFGSAKPSTSGVRVD